MRAYVASPDYFRFYPYPQDIGLVGAGAALGEVGLSAERLPQNGRVVKGRGAEVIQVYAGKQHRFSGDGVVSHRTQRVGPVTYST